MWYIIIIIIIIITIIIINHFHQMKMSQLLFSA